MARALKPMIIGFDKPKTNVYAGIPISGIAATDIALL